MTADTPGDQVNNAGIAPEQRNDIAASQQDLQADREQLAFMAAHDQALANQLRQHVALTNAILTSLDQAVHVLDASGRYTFVNPAAEQMFGWTSTELLGQTIEVVFSVPGASETTGTTVISAARATLQTGTTYRQDNATFAHRNGTMFASGYLIIPIIIDRQVNGAVITFRDTTKLQQPQRMHEEYISLITHDLRAPLTAILGRAELLLRHLRQQGLLQDANSARVLVESSHRMKYMLEELLDRSGTDAPFNSIRRTPTDLIALVQRMIEQTVIPNGQIRVTLDAVPSLWVVIDAPQIERVVVNLLTNAVKFSGPDAVIDIRVASDDTHASVAVADHGIGVALEELPRLFEKHYRSSTINHIAGSGLGLYISQLIIEAHGGRLWIESILGKGCTFTFILPLV